MIIDDSNDQVQTKGRKKNKKNKKNRNTNAATSEKSGKKRVIGVPTNHDDKLSEIGIMKKHNFMSATTPMLNQIFSMKKTGNPRGNKYEVAESPHHVSAVLKLVLNTMSTNELANDWTIPLWNISQQEDLMPEGTSVTFTRVFERRDNAYAKKKMKNRRRLMILSSESDDNVKRQGSAAYHDIELQNAIDSGDSVAGFGAEAIITAPNEEILEQAVDAVKNYLKSNDETRGLQYELDINKQNRTFLTFGPDDGAGNKDVYEEMTSSDMGHSALFVDSGGDRTLGSEYVGVSVGKMIRSHAAYNFKNHVSLYVGNDTNGKTGTIGGEVDNASEIYFSKITSRAYLLSGKHVTHFVLNNVKAVDDLMDFPINDSRKQMVDVSKGLLNILEAVDNGELKEHPERILSRFPTHINNIITLLSQFRDVDKISVNDEFANITRDILIDFFVSNKYWDYDAKNNLENLRLIGVYHNQFKTLSDFGQYIAQRKRSNTDKDLKEALRELDTIVNGNILATIPALNTHTDSVIDDLVNRQYRVVDLTGMSVGASGTVENPGANTMMISYMNLMIPTMQNGDVIFIHGISRISSIATIIKEMIASSGINLDVVYTEENQNAAVQMMSVTADRLEEEDKTTHKLSMTSKAMQLDFVMVDLYNNRTDKLIEPFGMDETWVKAKSRDKNTYFIKTGTGIDYIYLDRIF